MEQKVSNSTLAVLLILAIMVSVVGTWTVLEKTRQQITGQAVANQSFIEETIPAVAAPGMITGSTVNDEIYDQENEELEETEKGSEDTENISVQN